MTAAIEVDALTMSYAGRQVLTGVDLEVREGEVFCLLGPNGAGKTTTVEILEGFRRRTGGTVSVLGFDPQAQPARLRERIGIVLQECGFPRQARVGELIDSWRAYYSKPRELEELLKVVELTQDRNMQVRRLSGGQRRRLDLALALAGDPDLIFLDEPTTGFDPESRRRCWSAIENLRTLGKTVVLTTHYLDEAQRLADRVAILADGRIQVTGTVQEVARQAGVKSRIRFTAPERVRAGALVLPSSLEAAVSHGVAVCQADNPATALRELLSWAADHDLGDLHDLSVETPTLEDAYLQLVACPTEPAACPIAETAVLPGMRQADISRGTTPVPPVSIQRVPDGKNRPQAGPLRIAGSRITTGGVH